MVVEIAKYSCRAARKAQVLGKKWGGQATNVF